MSDRYGGQRFKRGLWHFALGKIVSAISGFLAMVLVIRLLPVQEFANYSVLISLVEVTTALSGFGLAHALLRYVPELYVNHYKTALRQFVFGAFSLKTFVLLLVAATIQHWSTSIAPMIGLGAVVDVFDVFLLLVIFRTTCHFTSQILESTLHQGVSQFAFSISSITRLLGMLYLQQSEHISLLNVVWVEVLGDVLGMIIILTGITRVFWLTKQEKNSPSDDAIWIKSNIREVIKFAASGYAQHVVSLPFGSDTNRLVGGHLFSSSVMANFGFSQSLYDYIQRYLPAQLLIGLIRPIVVARYSEKKDFAAAAKVGERVILINITIIYAIFTVLAVGGTQILELISGGRYGNEALLLLAMMLVVLSLQTHRLTLEMLVQTVKRYNILITSNIILSLSVIPAILLFSKIGAISFPLMNAIALLCSNFLVKRKLAKASYVMHYKHRVTLQLFILVLLASVWGNSMIYAGIHWLVATSIAEMFFSISAWIVCQQEIKAFVFDLTKNKK